MKFSLIVIRCKDIEASKSFYEKLGLSFNKEKHGNGPAHYSCEHDGTVFELYPNNGEPPQDDTRLGFTVSAPESLISTLQMTDSYQLAGNTIYVTADPDGRKIEISE